MTKQSKHKRLADVFPGETAESLAQKIGDLHYEDLPPLFKALRKKFQDDGANDFSNNRVRLATLLKGLGGACEYCEKISEQIWKLCKSYMK